ncbi:class II fructose-bisphosphate aldolase [Patescibacteria group bacterium]|nr:class II fructose-bisphosphate aldolase [Patescibacteria group bacterium]
MKKLIDLLHDYQSHGQALPAFNIDSFEVYQAVELAVRRTNLPCLVQLSAGEDAFIGAERLFLLVQKARLENLPLYLNMDHGADCARLKTLLRLGFDMVHFDGSKLDLATNQMLAKDLVDYAHYYHSLVEVEFDAIKPTESPDAVVLTDSVAAKKFLSLTAADFLAVSIGNRHGAVADRPENLNLPQLAAIRAELPTSFLTLHGGSGIPLDQIQAAIKSGIVKININTDLRHVFKTSLQQHLAGLTSDKLYDLLTPVISDLAATIQQKLINFSFS